MLHLGENSVSTRLRTYTPFLQLVLVLYYPFKGGWCCRHPRTQEKYCFNHHYCRPDRPSIVRSVGELPCSDSTLHILVRLELPFPVNTASTLQQSVLLYAWSSPYSADGGETALFAGYTAHVRTVGFVGTYGQSNDNAASSTTVGATVPQ